MPDKDTADVQIEIKADTITVSVTCETDSVDDAFADLFTPKFQEAVTGALLETIALRTEEREASASE